MYEGFYRDSVVVVKLGGGGPLCVRPGVHFMYFFVYFRGFFASSVSYTLLCATTSCSLHARRVGDMF